MGPTWTDQHAGYEPGAYNARDCWDRTWRALESGELRTSASEKGFDQVTDAMLLGLRLYTTEAYHPLNVYLRAVGKRAMGEPMEAADDLALRTPWPAFAWSVLKGFEAL